MKIQLLAAALLALSSSTFASSYGPAPTVTNNSTDALAVGGETLLAAGQQVGYSSGAEIAYNHGGRAIAGSIYFEGDACSCDFGDILNNSTGAVAIGAATAGSIHVNTTHSY